jgi:N6-adenosine-specific RNA methylase IME4
MTLRVEERIRSHIPPLRDDELRQLEENILRDGCKSPLIVWGDILIDGHNRYDICIRNDIAFETDDVEFEDIEAAIVWVEENQLGRRNLTPDQFNYFIGQKFEREKRATAGRPEGKLAQNEPISTAERIAMEHGVSRETVKRAAAFSKDVNTIADALGETVRSDILSGKEKAWTRADIAAAAEELPASGLTFKTTKDALAWAKEHRTEKAKVKHKQRIDRIVELSGVETALPNDMLFPVLYADPPWRFEPYSRDTGMDRAADNHYPTMTIEDIKALEPPSLDDAVLFLWATAPMLQEALAVMEAWGFEYKSQMVWVKDRIGTGYWARNKHEILLIGTKGAIPALLPGSQPASTVEAPVTEHSRKPEIFYDIIETMMPGMPYLEMFSRVTHPGWRVWGKEAGQFDLESVA